MMTVSAKPATPRLIRSRRRSSNPQPTIPSAPTPAQKYGPSEFHANTDKFPPVSSCVERNVPITSTQTAAIAFVHAALLRSAKASATGAQIAIAQPVMCNRGEIPARFCQPHPQVSRPSVKANTPKGNKAIPPIHASARRAEESAPPALAHKYVIAISSSPSVIKRLLTAKPSVRTSHSPASHRLITEGLLLIAITY